MSRRPDPQPSAYDSGTWDHAARVCPPPAVLGSRLDGELDPVRRRALEDHLDVCSDCAAEARRLESLAGLLRAWDAEKRDVLPPPRLHEQVLRGVAADAIARRHAVRVHFALVSLAAAAVVLVVGAAAWFGYRRGARDEVAPESVVASADTGSRTARVAAEATASELLVRAPSVSGVFAGAAEAPALASAASRLAVPPVARDAVLDDAFGKDAMARFARLRDVQDRLGELVTVIDGRALGVSAAAAFRGAIRRDRWIRDRLARATEPPTRDPADVGIALSHAVALPTSPERVSDWLGGLRRATLSAAPGTGGVRFHALPAKEPSDPDVARTIDLAEAVRSGGVRLLEDATPNPDVVVAYVTSPGAPVLVPAGELLRGGIAPRVVARGLWIPAGSGSSYLVRIPCRPIGRVVRGMGGSPAAVGAIAGPDLRAELARGGDVDAISAIVRAQLRDAAIAPRDAEESGLLALYDDAGRGDREAYARGIVADLASGPDDLRRGFLVTDLDGRWQGVESVAVGGAAGRAWLARLATGYLAEARTRSWGDAPRFGSRAGEVLSLLASRPVRLAPPRGSKAASPLTADEPRTGVLFEAVASDDGDVVLTSGLLPDVH